MRAAICRDFGQPLSIEAVELDPPGPGQVEVRLAACAICHSDISYINGIWGGTLPAVYGHEAAGIVTTAGPGVEGLEPGDRALVTLIRACGECPACRQGGPTSCEQAWDGEASPIRDGAGERLVQGMNTGGFAERVVVDRSQCVRLPEDLDLVTASLLSCGVITGVGAVLNSAHVQPGQSVAVIGAGGVGLNCLQGAALAGADPVVAIDISAERLRDARGFGATAGVLAGPDCEREVRALKQGRGLDFVFVSVGVAAVIADAVKLLARGGTLVMVGMPPSGANISLDPNDLISRNQRIVGARMGQVVLDRDIPMLIEHYRAGRLKLDELVAGRFRLDQINEAMERTKSGISGRNVIVFDGAGA